MKADWRTLLPEERGNLPDGGILRRTEANGAMSAPITILGVYPAATKWKVFSRGGVRMLLPVEVEEKSFDPASRSGGDLDKLYLDRLRIQRTNVLTVDLMPYFFANKAVSRTSQRSMWDNIQLYKQMTREKVAVEPRPPEDELLRDCRKMAGNQERLAEYLVRPSAKLMITLGREAAAYVRGYERAVDGQKHLYEEPTKIPLFGRIVQVVHLVHPGSLQRTDSWRAQHENWCKTTGRDLIQTLLNSQPLSRQGRQ